MDYDLMIFATLGDDTEKLPAVSSQNAYPFYLPDWQTKNLMPELPELLQQPESKAAQPAQ